MAQRKKKEYCQIIKCPNNLGSLDKSEAMFRYLMCDQHTYEF